MFEIGDSLREARLRQSIDMTAAEQATKIRGKYLRALEEEQFDVLPAQTYVKGFLRAYADYLGLDGQLYVDEYNSRFATGEEEPPAAPKRTYGGGGPRQLESNVVLIALGTIGLVTALVIVAWKFGGEKSTPSAVPSVANNLPPVQKPKPHARPRKHHPAVPATARFRVSATVGNCWLEVRRNGPHGKILFRKTLLQGQHALFVAPRLWADFGAPWNVGVRVNGRPVHLATSGSPTTIAVTRHGVSPAPPA